MRQGLLTTIALLLISGCSQQSRDSWIVQAETTSAAVVAADLAGGEVTHELPLINAIAVSLDRAQSRRLAQDPSLRLWPDTRLHLAGRKKKKKHGNAIPEPGFPGVANAAALHVQGIDGAGVNVAVLDTGWWTSHKWQKKDLVNANCVVAEYNAV